MKLGFAVPVARIWTRYMPGKLGKDFVWKHFYWRYRPYKARLSCGAWVEGHTEDLIQRYLYWFGVWEPGLTSWITSRFRKDRLFVDVGANIGYYTLLAATHQVQSTAIEASPKNYKKLLANLAMNPTVKPYVRPVNIAVTATDCTVPIYDAARSNIGMSSILNHDGRNPDAHVNGRPLPVILGECTMSRVGLIKIDVEGSESGVLEGLWPEIGNLPDDVEFLIEIDPELSDGSAIIQSFASHGFHAYRIGNSYQLDEYLSRAGTGIEAITTAPTKKFDAIFSRDIY